MADFPVLKISYFAVAVLTMGLMIAGSCLPSFMDIHADQKRLHIVTAEVGIWQICNKAGSGSVCLKYADTRLGVPFPSMVKSAQGCNVVALLSFAALIVTSVVIERCDVHRAVLLVPRVLASCSDSRPPPQYDHKRMRWWGALAVLYAIFMIATAGLMVHFVEKEFEAPFGLEILKDPGTGGIIAVVSILSAIVSIVLAHCTHSRVPSGLYQSL